jgi:O-antigen ligase
MFQLVSMLSATSMALAWLVSRHFPPWLSWYNEVAAFVAVLLFAWMCLAQPNRIKKSAPVSVPPLVLPFMALMLLAVVQGATGMITFWGDVWVFALYAALCVICAMLGFGLSAKSTNVLTWLAIVVVAGAFANAFVAWVQVLDVWASSDLIARMPQLRRPGGNLGQPNQLATLLLMGIASLLFLYESGKLKTVSGVLISFVLCTTLAMTESRTGVLSFFLLAGLYLYRRQQAGFKIPLWTVVLGCCAFLGFFWAWPSIFNFILQSTGVGAVVNTQPGSRLIVWPQLLEALAQRPWLGWGLNQVPKAHNAVASSHQLSEPFSYSHNILIDLGLGLGLPLAALLMFVTGVWLWRRVRLAKQLLPWYCIALVLPVAVHSMLEFPFTYAYFLVPVMFVLGVLEGLSGAKPAFTMGARPAAAILLVMSVVAAWSVVEYIEIEEDFRVARFEALRLGQTPTSYERPHILLLTQLDALLVGARIVPKPGMSPGELELAKKVALRYPWPATQNCYALSLALNGNSQEALRQLHVMRALHGETHFAKTRANWNALAQEKYPQLSALNLP